MAPTYVYVCTVTQFLGMYALWPWPWRYDVRSRSWHTLGSWTISDCVKYNPHPTLQRGVMARTQFLGMCALWPWPWRYDLGLRSWHTLGSWTKIVWNIIQIEIGSEDLWPGHGFWVCVHCNLDLEDVTSGQGHDTPLGYRQQLCEILSRSGKWVRSYGPDIVWIEGRTDRQT